jgi:hypothetical protein
LSSSEMLFLGLETLMFRKSLAGRSLTERANRD